ncbi:MAG: hypothetical protein SGILL_006033, partial [Bacillariaceae sp.]
MSSNKNQSLRTQALSVFVEQARKAAKEENDAFQNMQNLCETLTTVKLLNHNRCVATVKLSEYQLEDDEWYMYSTILSETQEENNATIVHFEQLNSFACHLGDLPLWERRWTRADKRYRFDPAYTRNGVLKITIELNPDVKIVANISDYPGTFEEVQPFLKLSPVRALLGPGQSSVNRTRCAPLMGAVLNVETLSVRKTFAKHLLYLVQKDMVEIPEHVKELKQFSRALYPEFAKDLKTAIALKANTQKLKRVVSYYQTVDVACSSSHIPSLKLESGTVGNSVTNDELRGWRIGFPNNISDVLLSDMKEFKVCLH